MPNSWILTVFLNRKKYKWLQAMYAYPNWSEKQHYFKQIPNVSQPIFCESQFVQKYIRFYCYPLSLFCQMVIPKHNTPQLSHNMLFYSTLCNSHISYPQIIFGFTEDRIINTFKIYSNTTVLLLKDNTLRCKCHTTALPNTTFSRSSPMRTRSSIASR